MLDPDMLEKLRYWIRERETVRLRKEAGVAKPWSLDKTFQTTYFCNVRREDDKTTKWIRSHWNVKDRNYEFAMCLARIFNKPSTLEQIGYPYADTAWSLTERIDSLRGQSQVFSGAYIVSTNGEKIDKLSYVEKILAPIFESTEFSPSVAYAETLEAAFRIITKYRGFGSFMAGQVIADLKNTAWHPLANVPDWNSWSCPGPGSMRGMQWLQGTKQYKTLNPRLWDSYMNELMEVLGMEHVVFHAQDIQNCLCEFDKYMRVSTGKGRSKRGYNGN